MRRLKPKLGTKSVPTGEVEFEGAVGYALRGRGGTDSGDAGGLNRMMEMVNGSRFGIAMMGLGIARRCFLEATVWAHHSHNAYEVTKWTEMEGTVTEIHFILPHSWVYLDVKDAAGATQVWALEATSRTGLERIGVKPDYLKVGDTVKARCHHLRDGSNGCLLGFLKAKDGAVKDWDGGNAPPPTDF